MTSLPSPFERLDARLQRWVYQQQWVSLRAFQEAAIEALLSSSDDLIVAASTASGKTEAVFLPLLSALFPAAGVRVMYVSPLKALINDQADRLERLGDRVEVPVHRWHGDVHSGKKNRLLERPEGVLLITPESLEALFVLRGPELGTILSALDTIVVDELHVFLGTERGRQLQSLMHRLEAVLGRRVRRVALSATIADTAAAARFLRRDGQAQIVTHSDQGREIRLQVRYCDGQDDIMRHLFDTLKASDNLVFCNRRRDVEEFTEGLRNQEAQAHLPAHFFPHHGSLSKPLREEVETRLRSGQTTTVVCTTTLELGIDFGQVVSVAQIDPPPSVSALFQRLGRSGRRGAPSAVRIYAKDAHPLHPSLVQATAMVSLLLERWMEPVESDAWHLSTLVQQVLSVIAERHGVTASTAFRLLCREGPFGRMSPEAFGLVLRTLGNHELLTQGADGTLHLTDTAMKLVGHFSFYAAFNATEEVTVKHGDRTVGALPVGEPLVVGSTFRLAGQAWRVIDVDRRQVSVVPAPVGETPSFIGTGVPVHDEVRRRMRQVYESDDIPRFLDKAGVDKLKVARETYRVLGSSWAVDVGDEVYLFPWRGDRVLHTLRLQLAASFPSIAREQAWLHLKGAEAEEVLGVVQRLAESGPASALDMASRLRNVGTEKWSRYLPQELLWAEYADRRLDVQGAWETLAGWARLGL
ncbi:MAG TPA: DEAD/DEAH box helicase [Candidatus Xenobia bacterium]|jgi:ATP-dependent Lhr-like helicase